MLAVSAVRDHQLCVPSRQMTSVLSLSPRVDHPGGVMQGPLLCVFTSTPAVCVQGACLTTESAHTFFLKKFNVPLIHFFLEEGLFSKEQIIVTGSLLLACEL